jgi:Protein of unknown function (DUF4012)
MTARRRAVGKVAIAVVAVGALVGGLTYLVAVPSVRDLQSARAVLGGTAADLTKADVARADRYLARVADRLDGYGARVLGMVPAVGPSLGAMRAVAESARPVLSAGLDLKQRLDGLRSEGLLQRGRIRIEDVRALSAPLSAEIDALSALEKSTIERRDGWVAPPVWDALDEIAGRTSDLRSDAETLADLLAILDDLLGGNGARTYLVMLLNNAELRGAGGVLTGLGSITVRDGRVSLGRFYPYENLRRDPGIPVPAPKDFERRYAIWGANNTIFINTTYSSDVPDTAIVASRLFEKVTGVATQGAFVVDPRGLAALLPPGNELSVPGRDLRITPDELPRFIYSDAYEVFDDQVERRAAILRLGALAFRDVVRAGSSDPSTTDAAGDAFAAGHLRFVSFDEDEQAVLDDLEVGGELRREEGDSLRVSAQNWGGGIPGQGSKLDYWVERSLRHRCAVSDDGSAHCIDHVTLANEAPEGLITYVAGRPYAMVRNNVETYVPIEAQLQAVRVDGEDAEHKLDEEEGHRIVEVYVEVPRGEARTITIQYALPAGEAGYSFRADPQPLARDATLEVALVLPPDWDVDGPGEARDGIWRYSGVFDETFELRAKPDQRTGIPGLWDSLTDFWTRPVFS